LKRWAIVRCPYGTITYPGLVVILANQFLAAWDKNVRAPITQGSLADSVAGLEDTIPLGLQSAADRGHNPVGVENRTGANPG